MGRTDYLQDERLRWLRFVLHPTSPRPEVRDWAGLYKFARKQALVGLCSPTRFEGELPPKELLLEWYATESAIRARNAVLNRRAVELTERLRADGMACCILKGQGNARLYPDPGLRMSGDIDVWVDAGQEKLREYVKKQFPDAKEGIKHIKFPVFEDVEVDVHDTPLKLYCPWRNRRLRRWLEENKAEQMAHLVRLPGTDTDVAVPTVAFNAVYQLGHILIHFIDEGIGLRQIVDYFYVLRELGGAGAAQQEAVRRTWRRLGLLRLARALMWVEREILGLEDEFLPVPPSAGAGRLLAHDILDGGNFGRHSSRQRFRRHGRAAKAADGVWHLLRLSTLVPGEAFFHFCHKSRAFITKFVLK